MSFTRIASLSLASSLVLAGAALAQDPAPAPRPDTSQTQPAVPSQDDDQSAKKETASGTLTKVDADKKTLSVKSADGAEMTFSYDATTEITGDQKGEQGLATAEGSMVTVHYSTEGAKKVASKIEVQPRSSQQ